MHEYVAANDVTIWHGDYGLGSLTFIDVSDLHVVFDSRLDYENWDACGRPIQMTLF
uniref:Uncharacterized protein n=1 Tax=Dulem virus 192 TaxID=3145669 RepID=A0AAU8B354_9VIRU